MLSTSSLTREDGLGGFIFFSVDCAIYLKILYCTRQSKKHDISIMVQTNTKMVILILQIEHIINSRSY